MLATIRRIAFLIAASLFATLGTAQTIYTTHDNNGRSIGTINASTGSGTDIGATGESSYALHRTRLRAISTGHSTRPIQMVPVTPNWPLSAPRLGR